MSRFVKKNDKTYYRLIHSARWRALRRKKLNASPLCERCMAEGIKTAAVLVHHIHPIEGVTDDDKARWAFDFDNLMSLCEDCHVQMHAEMRSHSIEHMKQNRRNATALMVKELLGIDTTGNDGAAS